MIVMNLCPCRICTIALLSQWQNFLASQAALLEVDHVGSG